MCFTFDHVSYVFVFQYYLVFTRFDHLKINTFIPVFNLKNRQSGPAAPHLSYAERDVYGFGQQPHKSCYSPSRSLNPMPVELLTNKAKTPAETDIQLLWTNQSLGEFQFTRQGDDTPLATGCIKPDSGITVQAYDGKGGFSVIINTPQNRYILMPGSEYREGDNVIATSGQAPSTHPLPTSLGQTVPKTSRQTHTDMGMILGAGLSSRIEPIPTLTQAAKPAFKIAENETLIGRSARMLKEHGIKHVFVNTFYKPETTEAALKQSSLANGFEAHCLDERQLGDQPSGTAGGLLRVLQDPTMRQQLNGKHLVLMAGDSLMDFDFSDLVNRHVANHAALTLAGYKIADEDLDKFGIITTDTGHSGDITGFVEKPGLQKDGLAKIGDSRLGNTFVHVIAPELYPIIEAMANDPAFIERQKDPKAINPGLDFAMDIYPRVMTLIKQGKLTRQGKPLSFRAEEVTGYWSDVGNPAAYFHALDALHGGLVGTPPKNDTFYKNGVVYWDKAAYDNVKQAAVSLTGNAIVMANTTDN
jgi:NDP-sugar pyrophosphorylase family protein